MPRTPRAAAPKPAKAAATTPRPRKPAAPRTTAAAPPAPPTHDEIARLAHELFVSAGSAPGRDVEFWLEAERRLKGGLSA